MLDRGELRRLHRLTQDEACTMTLYVDVDQNRQANRNGGHLVQAEAFLRQLRTHHPEASGLEQAAGAALELLRATEPEGKTAVIVVHPESGLAELHRLNVPVAPSAHWRRGAFLRPVVEALDEHERYAVVLADKKRARVFTVWMGEISEHPDVVSATASRTQTTGTDHWCSQKRFQRHHQQEVAWHGRRVVEALLDLSLRTAFDRLVVAGPAEAAAQIVRLLPRRLHGRLVATLNLPVTAPEAEVLGRVLELEEQVEREQEHGLVQGLLAELHDGGKAVAGLPPVLAAVNQGKVWKLVYAKGFQAAGGECRGCGCFTQEGDGSCSTCTGGLEPVPTLVDRLSQAVLEQGGGVEVVDGPAADLLRRHAPCAAVLRY